MGSSFDELEQPLVGISGMDADDLEDLLLNSSEGVLEV